MFIDAHTHHHRNHLQASQYFEFLIGKESFGIHPWELSDKFDRTMFLTLWDTKISKFEESGWNNILAIGECGLDRRRKKIAHISDQIWVLEKHFELALSLKKPLVLHLVHAVSDLLFLLKKYAFFYPILIHGYQGKSIEEVEALTKYSIYFGIGERIFCDDKILKLIPLDRILLETDDKKDLLIEDVYDQVARGLGLSLPNLEERIEKNFHQFLMKDKS